MQSARRRSTGLTEEPASTSCRLLVSVRDAEEARAAVGGGAGIVDIKEPDRGPLGRADAAVVAKIAGTVARLAARETVIPVSVALGELLDECESSGPLLPAGAVFYKTGLSGCARRGDWQARLDRLRESVGREGSGASLVAVAYADHERALCPEPMDVLQYALSAKLQYILVDTFDKARGHLGSFLPRHYLADLLSQAHRRGLKVALAGSLSMEKIAELVKLGADVIAVRGAACRGTLREGPVEMERVAELAGLVAQVSASR